MRRYIISKHIKSTEQNKQCYKCHTKFNKQTMNQLTQQQDQVFLCDQCYEKYATTCEKCSQVILKQQNQLENSHVYVCQDCKIDFQKCEDCGKYFDKQNEGGIIQKQYYCQDCYDQLSYFCEYCGNVGFYQDRTETYDKQGNSIYVCDDCKSDFVTQCHLCDCDINIYDPNDSPLVYHTNDYICLSCYDDCNMCNDCGQIYLQNEMYLGDDQQYYCQDCIGSHQLSQIDPNYDDNDVIYPYERKISIDKKKVDEQEDTKQYIGVELQIRNQNRNQTECDEFVKQVSKNKNVIFKEDGSVLKDGNVGVEIVSQPCTYNFHKHEFGWQRIFHYMKQYNMINTSNCGLHFHISRDNFTVDQQKCLDYFVNNATKFLSQIGGRDYAGDEGTYCKAVHKEDFQYGRNKNDRYQAVNFANSDTVQLRFMKSTNSFSQFRKRLGTVHNICKLAKFFTFQDLKVLDETDLKYCFHQVVQNIH